MCQNMVLTRFQYECIMIFLGTLQNKFIQERSSDANICISSRGQVWKSFKHDFFLIDFLLTLFFFKSSFVQKLDFYQ